MAPSVGIAMYFVYLHGLINLPVSRASHATVSLSFGVEHRYYSNRPIVLWVSTKMYPSAAPSFTSYSASRPGACICTNATKPTVNLDDANDRHTARLWLI